MPRSFLPLFISPALASGERQLVAAINDYRAQPQRCEGRRVLVSTPLALKSSLALPVGYGGALREGLKDAGYQAVKVRSIRVVGATDAEEAFDRLRSHFCAALLDNQFADIGVSRSRNEWQVVLARPCSTHSSAISAPRATRYWRRSTPPGPSRGCVVASASPLRARSLGTLPWARQRSATAGRWPTATISRTATPTVICPQTGRGMPATGASDR